MHVTQPGEQWLPIPGYCGNYEASNLGRIRSLDRMERIGKYTRRRKGRVLKPANINGYLHVDLNSAERSGTRTVHTLVAEAFHGPRPTPGHECCHNNGVSLDNRAENLRWDTARENQRDRRRHGQVYTNQNTRLTHCRYGHPFGPGHTIINKKRYRICLKCDAARQLIGREARAHRITYREMSKALPMPEALRRLEESAAAIQGGVR